MRNDLICAVLDCGTADLNLLDHAEADLFEIVNNMRFNNVSITMNSIMAEVFIVGLKKFGSAVKDKYQEFLYDCKYVGTPDEDTDDEKVLFLRRYDALLIDPTQDFAFFVNCLDTSIYFCSNMFNADEKKKFYKEYLADEIEAFEHYTGFSVGW